METSQNRTRPVWPLLHHEELEGYEGMNSEGLNVSALPEIRSCSATLLLIRLFMLFMSFMVQNHPPNIVR